MADVQIFREHLEKHNLVGFGGYKIKTYCDEEGNVKKTLGTGKWKHINTNKISDIDISKELGVSPQYIKQYQ